MTSPSLPAPLFDLVTGFPPDDALDLTVPMPVSLAVYMTILESTGHAAELAVLRRLHVEQARETARRVRTPAGRPRITHIVEERVRRVHGLRPHVHVFVGTTARDADGTESRVDVDELASWARSELLPDHRDRLVAATTEACGLRWGATDGSPLELVDPPWVVSRAAAAQHDDLTCPGPWPRHQIL